ncbi:hypothetical protein Tco_1301962 [Tanacetum coccineum]
MTLALLVHHSLKLLSHQHGRSLTLEMLLQAPQATNQVLMLTITIETDQYQHFTNIVDSEDSDSTHLPKTKSRPDWLKPIPDDDRPATLEPTWVIPTSHIHDAVNNWANALASTYQALAENSLLEKIGNMWTFMNWYCQKMGMTKLTQAAFEGEAYEVANPEGDQVRIDISRPLPLSGLPVSTEEPMGKSKRVKRPAKKSTQATARGVVIRETPEMPVSKKKEMVDVARGVPDVTEEEPSESETESWGNDEDDSNNDQETRSK